MANSVVVEHHFKLLKEYWKKRVRNNLLDKSDKFFNTYESGINMDLRQDKVVVSHGSKQAQSQSKAPMIT